MAASEHKQFLGCALSGFRLTHFLGSGGTAFVFRGENLVDSSILRAIKVVRPELAAKHEFRLRFAEEARTLERLAHPNVVRFFGLRESDGYLVMELELLAGAPLSELLGGDSGPPDIHDVVGWFTQIADGVAAAHAIGIIHRDLKPENLFLTEGFVAKVLDFGIARARDEATRAERATVVGTTPGTPAYIAPEVWNGAIPGQESDIYALALSLWEVLAGHHPFLPPGGPAKGHAQLMFSHLEGELPSVRDVRPDVPESLDALIALAAHKDPEQRLRSAAELAQQLRAVQAELSRRQLEAAVPRTQFALPQFKMPSSGKRVPPAPKPAVKAGPPERADSVSAVVTKGKREGLRNVGTLTAAGVILAGGLAVASFRLGRQFDVHPTSPSAVPSAPALNRWIKIAAPPSPWLLGVDDASREPTGFRAGKQVTFAGPAFEIQEHEVTWEELESWSVPADIPAKPKRPQGQSPKHPAVSVPWRTANAYCESLGGALPNERQWEFAARGVQRRKQPWGDATPDPLRTRAGAGSTVAVGKSLQDRTPEGVLDLAGNAEEWTGDIYEANFPNQDETWAVDGTTTFRTVRGLGVSSKDLRRVSTTVARRAVCATGSCEQATNEQKSLLLISPDVPEPLPAGCAAIVAAISAAKPALLECASGEEQTVSAIVTGKAQATCRGIVSDYYSEYDCIQDTGKDDLIKPVIDAAANECLKNAMQPLLSSVGPNGAPRRWKGVANEQWSLQVRLTTFNMSRDASRDIGFRCVRGAP